jgi:hypothetical protein
MKLVFRVLKKSRKGTELALEQPVRLPDVADETGILPAGLLEIGRYAQSVIDGRPDSQLLSRYENTPLAPHLLAIAANPKIAKVYA